MIQVNGLTKEYAGRRAINDVSFSVERGEILGFLGPNGAGKTTTMRILTGFLPPTSGSASVAGFDVETQSLQARRHIGYLPESVPLYRELKVYDYLDFIAQLRGIPKVERPAKIDKAIERLNLGSVADRYISKLSKGYRQRVGIAQAVMHEPDVMILDEPTEGLDPRQRTETRALIRELGKEHTVILSTHILPEVEATCDRVLIISEGKIVASDTPEGLSTTLKRGQRLEVLVHAEEAHVRLALHGIDGITKITSQDMPENRRRVDIEGLPDIELRHLVARSLIAADIDLFELRAEAISLEDIFLRLTTADPEHREEAPSARERDTADWAAERAAGEVGLEADAGTEEEPRA
ncbi:MAG: gliding motility-associated transport system ATP-binding protein [Chloroflexota bacterium]|jgi:ABC-2 type transport system ATP-binding protein|nr:gliding motility-associated transport system ATP-binding protein [Chloroflexota bacterium]